MCQRAHCRRQGSHLCVYVFVLVYAFVLHVCLCTCTFTGAVGGGGACMCESLYVCMCEGFNEALLTQHISPGMGDSGAGLSEFAWARCQKIASVPHSNVEAKRAGITLLANLIPIIPVLLDSLTLWAPVGGTRSSRCPHTCTCAHTHTHTHTHAPPDLAPFDWRAQPSVARWVGDISRGPDQWPSRLPSELPFYWYRSEGKSRYWWRALCSISVIFTIAFILYSIYCMSAC